MFSRPRPHDVNVRAHGVTRILNGHNPSNIVFKRHHAAGESGKLVHGTRATNEDGGDYFNESGWREKLTQKVPNGLKTAAGFLIVLGSVLGGYLFGDDKSEEDREEDAPGRWASLTIFIVSVIGLGYVVWGM